MDDIDFQNKGHVKRRRETPNAAFLHHEFGNAVNCCLRKTPWPSPSPKHRPFSRFGNDRIQYYNQCHAHWPIPRTTWISST